MSDVELTQIDKRFGDAIVIRRLDLHVRQGEFLTILGPSGCGKSTLLRIIAGLDRDYGGTVVIGGKPVDGLRPKERDLAMVFQSYALYPHMTAAQNIAVPLVMRRLAWWQRLPIVEWLAPSARAARAGIARDVRELAATLQIVPLLARKPGALSGGQRQRVALARAMVRHPAVFLMDEPLSNLDATLRVAMRAEIAQLHRRLGATFVYVTHDQAEAMTMSDRVAVMIDGRLLQVGAPQQVYADPAHVDVARFIGSPRINLLPAVVREDGVIDVAGARLPFDGAASGARLLAGIRSENVTPGARAGADTLAGRVVLIEHMGSDVFVHAEVPGLAEPVIARATPAAFAHGAIGQVVHLALAAEPLAVFGESGARLAPRRERIAHARAQA